MPMPVSMLARLQASPRTSARQSVVEAAARTRRFLQATDDSPPLIADRRFPACAAALAFLAPLVKTSEERRHLALSAFSDVFDLFGDLTAVDPIEAPGTNSSGLFASPDQDVRFVVRSHVSRLVQKIRLPRSRTSCMASMFGTSNCTSSSETSKGWPCR